MKSRILGALLCAIAFVCSGFGADGVIVLQQSGTQQGVQSSKYTVLNCTLGMTCTSTSGKFVLTSAAGAVTWRGAWLVGTAYVAGDAVGYTVTGVAYVAIASSTGVTPGTDSTKWVTIGTVGPTGATGATGSAGAAGSNGTNGTNGNTVLNGSGAPSGGANGDFWIDTTAKCIYGPKAAGVWPGSCTSLIGTLTSASSVTLTGTAAGEIDFGEAIANGSNYVAVKAPDSVGSNVTLTLPESTGIVGVVPFVLATTSTPISVSSTDNAGFHFNQHATAATAIVYNLPATVAGKQFCFTDSYNGSASNTGTLTITPAASSYIIKDGVLSTVSKGWISGGAAGDSACVVGTDSTHWTLYVQKGTWTAVP